MSIFGFCNVFFNSFLRFMLFYNVFFNRPHAFLMILISFLEVSIGPIVFLLVCIGFAKALTLFVDSQPVRSDFLCFLIFNMRLHWFW